MIHSKILHCSFDQASKPIDGGDALHDTGDREDLLPVLTDSESFEIEQDDDVDILALSQKLPS